jgi:hypothetical protein
MMKMHGTYTVCEIDRKSRCSVGLLVRIVICVEVFGWFMLCPLDLGALQIRCDCPNDASSHSVLQIKCIFECTIKAVRPEMCSRSGIDKLPCDSKAIAALPTLPSSM